MAVPVRPGRIVQQDLEIQEYTDPENDPMIPHTVVLRPGLVVHTIYNGYCFWGRPSFYDLWRDLRDLSREIRPDRDLSKPGLREVWEAGDYSPFHGWDKRAPAVMPGRHRHRQQVARPFRPAQSPWSSPARTDQGLHGRDGSSEAATVTAMSTIHLNETTTSTPAQFLAGLTDFGPGREKLFGRSADGFLKVHDQGPTSADVTEGSGGIWERLHYDWSDPNRVVMTTTDSNTWGGRSGHTYTFTQNPDGTTDVDAVVVRDGKNLKGRALGLLLGIVGKRVLGKELAQTSKAIEARNSGEHSPSTAAT